LRNIFSFVSLLLFLEEGFGGELLEVGEVGEIARMEDEFHSKYLSLI
jgi:hypothetical protein